MKKWALAVFVAFFAVVAVAAGAVALTDESGGDRGESVSRDADDRDESDGPNVAPVCAPDVPNCDDMIVNPDGNDGAAGICLEGVTDCVDTPSGGPVEGPLDHVCIGNPPEAGECLDPDEPVSSEPPVTIIDGRDPDECSLVHNIEVCEKDAIALAIEDLSLRLGSPQAITVVSSEFVEWPDSCIGITKTDRACAEVITPGFRIVLAAGEHSFEYHTAGVSRAELVE